MSGVLPPDWLTIQKLERRIHALEKLVEVLCGALTQEELEIDYEALRLQVLDKEGAR